MPKTPYPLRVRLHGGRSVHAAHTLSISGGAETACDYYIDILADNHWLDDDTEVTYKRCQRALKREVQR